MLTRTVDVFVIVWPSMAVGTVLVIGAAWLGWVIGRLDSLVPVRVVAWWVTRVIVPLVRSRSWWRRAAVIFANNTSVLAAVLAVGFHRALSVTAVVGLGVSLGIGLRVLSSRTDAFCVTPKGRSVKARHRITIGVALNLLEPPAILITIGLSLGRTAVSLPAGPAWETFAVWAVPLLLVAAAGEALWLGSGLTNAHGSQGGSADVPTSQWPLDQDMDL